MVPVHSYICPNLENITKQNMGQLILNLACLVQSPLSQREHDHTAAIDQDDVNYMMSLGLSKVRVLPVSA
jgi:hypothetical protein